MKKEDRAVSVIEMNFLRFVSNHVMSDLGKFNFVDLATRNNIYNGQDIFIETALMKKMQLRNYVCVNQFTEVIDEVYDFILGKFGIHTIQSQARLIDVNEITLSTKNHNVFFYLGLSDSKDIESLFYLIDKWFNKWNGAKLFVYFDEDDVVQNDLKKNLNKIYSCNSYLGNNFVGFLLKKKE